MIDFTFSHDGGSIALLTPNTDAARKWLHANVGEESQYLGISLAIEPRYCERILRGITSDGLTVERA